MIGALAFFTRPDTGKLVAAVAVIAATAVTLSGLRRLTQPKRPVADAPSPEVPFETPALASLLTNGYSVGPPAVLATLLDLVSRGWLRIEHAGHEVVVLTDQRGSEGDVLTRYEQQVLNHVHRLTAGTLSGVSGAGVEIAGLRLPRRWFRRFERHVVADAHAQRLSRRRWNPLTLAVPVLGVVVAALLWWSSVRSGTDVAVADSVPSRVIAVVVGLVLVLLALRVLRTARSRAQVPTASGAERATEWMALRNWMEPRGFEGASSGTANNPSRALAYAAAMGLAERAAEELPIVPEDDRLAWSNARGEWHVVRVRYPFVPGYGRHPAFVLVVGLLASAGLLALHRFLVAVSRGDALAGVIDDFPDQSEWLERIALGLGIAALVPMIWTVWLAVAGAFDLFASIHRQGVVVRARRPARVVPLARLLGPLARRDRFALFIAVDDGRRDVVRAWLANERTAVPQGARAKVRATPLLGYVRGAEPIGATRTSVVVPASYGAGDG